ncbi:hypothetical protein ASE61_13375 [Bosea sp. Root670]|nr:hypothetical protein ASE61_13375 [Bosea sp. Root670]
MAYDSIAILGMDPRNPRLVTFVRSICRQSMNRQVFRGSLVAKCAFSEIDFKAPDLSDALHARELVFARA